MTYIVFPSWTVFNVILYSGLAVIALGAGLSEYYGLTSLRYSKFRRDEGMPSRLGMFIIYFVPLVVHAFFATGELTGGTPAQFLFSLAFLLHFGKRSLEVLFLHRYSGPIDDMTVLQITGFYSLVAFFVAYLNRQPVVGLDIPYIAGMLLFVSGQGVNLLHHKILADLRQHETGYVIPRRGLFVYVSSPHYLGEILAWLGLALMSRHLGMYLVFLAVTGYLVARSLKTHQWYHRKFRNYPRDRKALIPFLL